MMKAKKYSDEGFTPRHRYFWMAHLTDGSVIPEYDLINRRQNKTRDLPLDFVCRFGFYPVTPKLAKQVKKFFGEILQPCYLPRYEIDINLTRGDRLRVHPVWRNLSCYIGNKQCVTTKYALFTVKKDGSVTGFFVNEDGEMEIE